VGWNCLASLRGASCLDACGIEQPFVFSCPASFNCFHHHPRPLVFQTFFFSGDLVLIIISKIFSVHKAFKFLFFLFQVNNFVLNKDGFKTHQLIPNNYLKLI